MRSRWHTGGMADLVVNEEVEGGYPCRARVGAGVAVWGTETDRGAGSQARRGRTSNMVTCTSVYKVPIDLHEIRVSPVMYDRKINDGDLCTYWVLGLRGQSPWCRQAINTSLVCLIIEAVVNGNRRETIQL